MSKKTLHHSCTWKEESVCVECGLKGELGCRQRRTKESTAHIIVSLPENS